MQKMCVCLCVCIYICIYIYFFLWRCDPQRVMASFLRFLDHTQRRTTFGRTPLDEWSARRTDLYLTTNNTHNRQTSMLPVGFEPTISAGERPQTYALDRAATGTGIYIYLRDQISGCQHLSQKSVMGTYTLFIISEGFESSNLPRHFK